VSWGRSSEGQGRVAPARPTRSVYRADPPGSRTGPQGQKRMIQMAGLGCYSRRLAGALTRTFSTAESLAGAAAAMGLGT
jgi:hypothetical protein